MSILSVLGNNISGKDDNSNSNMNELRRSVSDLNRNDMSELKRLSQKQKPLFERVRPQTPTVQDNNRDRQKLNRSINTKEINDKVIENSVIKANPLIPLIDKMNKSLFGIGKILENILKTLDLKLEKLSSGLENSRIGR